MSEFHIKMTKIKTEGLIPLGWTVFNFDSNSEMKAFQEQVNEVYRQMMSQKNIGKTVSITGEVKG